MSGRVSRLPDGKIKACSGSFEKETFRHDFRTGVLTPPSILPEMEGKTGMSAFWKTLLFVGLFGYWIGAVGIGEELEGRWKYVSITSGEAEMEIHEGDGIVFTKDSISWRWLGRDHFNTYRIEPAGEFTGFVGFDENGSPMIRGIFRFEDGRLIVCDRPAREGFPKAFSPDEGTLIVLEREPAEPKP